MASEMINESDRLLQEVKETLRLGRTPNISDIAIGPVDEERFLELCLHGRSRYYRYFAKQYRIQCREAAIRSLCRHFGVDTGRAMLEKLVLLAKAGIQLRDEDWKVFIAENVPTEGILADLCKIGGNLRKFKSWGTYVSRLNPMCLRRRMYMNIADIGELLIPHEKDLTECFLTACQHNPYLAMRLAYSANIHAVTGTGMNAVSLAVAHGFPILAVQLIDLGVTPFKKNHRGMIAFDFVEKTYSVNKVVKYGLRRAVKRYQNRQSVHQILEIGFQDFIVAGIVMEYLPIRTQNKIKCWKNNCWKYEFHCWQCSLIDDGCPFPFEYCQVSGSGNCGNKKHCKKYYETMHFVRALQGGWRCLGGDSTLRYHFLSNTITNLSPPVDSIDFTGDHILVKQASVTYEGYFDRDKREICWNNGDIWTQLSDEPAKPKGSKFEVKVGSEAKEIGESKEGESKPEPMSEDEGGDEEYNCLERDIGAAAMCDWEGKPLVSELKDICVKTKFFLFIITATTSF